MILLLDNYDSFTYNLVDYFGQLGLEVKVCRNDTPLEEIKKLTFSGLVLSPGPGRPKEAGHMMEVLHHYQKQLPVLGICLGHQAIGELLGGHLEKAAYPMHGKVSVLQTQEGILFRDLPREMEVVRYHSLVLKDLPEAVKITSFTSNGEVMSLEEEELMLMGVQFHPEAVLTQHGLQILKNWTRFYDIV